MAEFAQQVASKKTGTTRAIHLPHFPFLPLPHSPRPHVSSRWASSLWAEQTPGRAEGAVSRNFVHCFPGRIFS